MIAQMQILLEKEHWFKTSQEAIDSVEEYKKLLYRRAEEQLLKGGKLGDQSIPIELFAFKPDFSTLPSVALLGGMGPLAGAEGFIKACQQFLDSREIVLLQACSVPDRSEVIVKSQADAKKYINERRLLIDLLCVSIKKLISKIERKEKLKLVVLCNTAHHFLPEVFSNLADETLPKQFELVSLVEEVVLYTKRHMFTKVLLLNTLGAKLCQLYSRRFDEEAIPYMELSEKAQSLLMRAIFQGVKAFNEQKSIEFGEQFFTEVVATAPEVDCLVAGCTEIPHLIKLLQSKANKSVRDFLFSVSVIDPVMAALNTIKG